jgi:hypothetical protein
MDTGVAFDFETSGRSGVVSRVAYAVTAAGEVFQLEEDASLSPEEAFGAGGLARGEQWHHLRFRGAGRGGQAPVQARLGGHALPEFAAFHVDRVDGRLQLTGERDGQRLGLASVIDEQWQTLNAEPADVLVFCPPGLPEVTVFATPAPYAPVPPGPRSRLSPLAARLALARLRAA